MDGFPKIRDTADIMVYKNGRQTSSNGVVSERISSKSIRVDSQHNSNTPVQVNETKDMTKGKGCKKEKCIIF